MIHERFNGHLVEYALPENLDKVFGLENCDCSDELYKSAWLAPAFDNLLLFDVAVLPPVEEAFAPVLKKLLTSEPTRLRQLAGIIAVLSNARVLAKVTNGETLRFVTKLTGIDGIVHLLRRFENSPVQALASDRAAEVAELEILAGMSFCLVLGLIPEPYMRRYAFQYPMSEIRQPLSVDPETDDREHLLSLLDYAFSLIGTDDDEEAEDN